MEPPKKNRQKYIRYTMSYPAEFEPLIKKRLEEEPYSSKNAFLNGLLFYELSTRAKHWLTSRLMSQPQEVIDKVVDEIVRDFDTLPRRDGGWFRGMVQQIIDEHHGKPLSGPLPGSKKKTDGKEDPSSGS